MVNTFANWNYAKLDPPEAVFAKEVLNKKKSNIMDDILGVERSNTVSQASNHLNISNLSNQQNGKSKKSVISFKSMDGSSHHSMNDAVKNRRRVAMIPNDFKKIVADENIQNTKIFQTLRKKESHPVG